MISVRLVSLYGLFLSLGATAVAEPESKIEFKLKGGQIKSFTLAQLQKQFGTEKVTVLEEHEEKKQKTYLAIPLQPILMSVYGDAMPGLDEVLFTCLDGYQPSIALTKVVGHRNWLAYANADGSPFRFKDKTGKEIEYGPFYLIWDNVRDPLIKAEGDEDWPYQLSSVDLILFTSRFGSLAPPPNSPAAVKRGFVAYRKQCFQCHTINGEGGAKGFELNYPVNVTEYFKESYLKKWIDNPASIRYNATMPQLNPAYPQRKAMINDIITYLKAMKKRKVAPAPPKQ